MKNLLFFILVLFLIRCSGKESYSVQGTILEVRKDSNELLIHHDEISGFMMAMTMPFKLSDNQNINSFEVGDSLKFRLEMKEKKAYATNFQFLGKGTLPEMANLRDDEYTPLKIGDIFSNATFLDLDSNRVSLSDTDGKFRFISYIFTRCPMPNMCPAVVAKNQYLAETFSKNSAIEFILISFDYMYDTPSIMKSVYNSYTMSHPNMKFYSSSGHLNDIFMLAGQSTVSFWGVDENDIGHTLRSVMIDPERRLMQVYDGTDWHPEATERNIRNTLKAYH